MFAFFTYVFGARYIFLEEAAISLGILTAIYL